MAIEEITPDLVATMAGQIEAVGNAKEHTSATCKLWAQD
jgi:hypothetical protein